MASMDARQRSQSVPTVQAPARPSNQSRAGKVIQRVTNIKGCLRFSSRKPKDERETNPYPDQTRSMDGYREGGTKPYMSQPSLSMVVQPLNHRYHHSEDSSASASPSPSPSRSVPRKPELPQLTHNSPQSLPRHSIPAVLIPGIQTGAAPVTHSMDGSPGSRSQYPLGGKLPSSAGMLEATTPEIVISDPSGSTPRSRLPSTSSGLQTTHTHNGTGTLTLSPASSLTRSHSITRLNNLRNESSSHISSTSSQSIASRKATAVSLPPLPAHPLTTTYPSSAVPRQPSHHFKVLPSIPPPLPSSKINATQAQSTAQPRPRPLPPPVSNLDPSPIPRPRNPAPKLSLPPVNRLSLTMPDGYSARFSPSIVMCTPPLSINLPPLPAILPEPWSLGTGQGRIGLRSLPELPHQGTDKGDNGEGDDVDEEGDEEDEEEQEQEQETDAETLRDGSSIYHDADSQDEQHHPLKNDSDVVLGASLTSLRKSPSQSSPYGRDAYSGLPEMETSHFDIDLSFLNHPPTFSSENVKGKGKARSPPADTERTPTSSSIQYDYFGKHCLERERKSSGGRDTAQLGQPQAEGSSHRHEEGGVSPVHTPRESNISVRMTPHTSAASVTATPRTPGQSSMAMSSHLVSRNLDVNAGLHLRPGMYKQTSQSMVDIHAAKKKELVVEMVRGAEEEASVEEKERRRRSVIMNGAGGKGKENGGQALVAGERLGAGITEPPVPSTTMPVHGIDGEPTKSKRTTKAPAYEASPYRLRRRRSMPSFIATSDPPPYPAFERYAHMHGLPAQLSIQPRDDEGQERLPAYSNGIYLKSVVPRKMEFLAAGVQAKDRKWRRVVCVLEGTALKVYRCPKNVAGVSALGGLWERAVGVGDVAVSSTGNGVASGSGSESGSTAARERGREVSREEGRVAKGGSSRGQTDLHVPASSSIFSSPSQLPAQSTSSSSSRSRLGLANLLKPGRAHARSTSEVQPPSRPRSPRPSLNIPGTASGSGAGSRSHSPIAPSVSTTSISSHSAFSVPTTTSSSQSQVLNRRGNSSTEVDATPTLESDPSDLIRVYTMQHAESGLGNDYLKRKNVIRVRVEGEQFLLQAKDVVDVVAWIEGLQAAANIALDLDERVMPKGPLFPRRRRRRGARRPVENTERLAGPVSIPLSH